MFRRNPVYHRERVVACAVGLTLTYVAYYKCLYDIFAIQFAISVTSILYHGFHMIAVKSVDTVLCCVACPYMIHNCLYVENYAPTIFYVVCAYGYIFHSSRGTMREHFLYVHIPVLTAQALHNAVPSQCNNALLE